MGLELKALSEKVDKLIDLQEKILTKLNMGVLLSEENSIAKPLAKKLTKKEEFRQRVEEMKEELTIRLHYGGILKRKFNLVVEPSAARIKAYLRTNDVSAFDGLKRNPN